MKIYRKYLLLIFKTKIKKFSLLWAVHRAKVFQCQIQGCVIWGNPKNHLFKEFIRIVKDIRPKWFVLENVWGMTKMDNGKTIAMIEDCFRAIEGYNNIKSKVLCADDFGVPQHRTRLFMVGNNQGIDFEFPMPHSEKISVMEAIGDVHPALF